MNTPALSIVVPTIRYHQHLDEALGSVLALNRPDLELVVNINSPSEDYSGCRYWQDPRVIWYRNEERWERLGDSFTSAVRRGRAARIFVLADDDYVEPDFLVAVDFDTLDSRDLLVLPFRTVDENNRELVQAGYGPDDTASGASWVRRSIRGRVWHHLSLVIFPRTWFDEIGGYPFTGFPQGFYVDSVFHTRLFIRARQVIVLEGIRFSRRITDRQASANFYWEGKSLLNYFDTTIEEMTRDERVQRIMTEEFKCREKFRTELLLQRLNIDLLKLEKNYSHEGSRRFELYRKAVFWKLGSLGRLKAVRRMIRNEINLGFKAGKSGQ